MDKIIRKIKQSTTPSFLFFSIIIVFLLLPRIVVFFTKEDYFGGDFAFYYFNAREIILNHHFPLIGHVVGDIGGFSQGAGWNYLLAIPFVLFNGDPFGGKVLMLIISSLTLIIGSFASWYFIGKREGLFVGILLGLSPYLVNWTNDVWPPYVIPIITIFYLTTFSLFLSKQKKKYFFFMTGFLGSMLHFEIASFGLLFPSFLLLSIYLILKGKLTKRDMVFSILILLFFFLPHLIYDLTHNFYNLKGIIGLFPDSSSRLNSDYLLIIGDRFHLFKTDFIEVFPTANVKYLFLSFAFLLFGYLLYIKDKKNKKWKKIFISYVLIAIPLTFLGLVAIPVQRASFWWLTYLTIFYIYFAGIIMSFLLFHRSFLYKLAVVAIIILFLHSSIINFNLLLNKKKELQTTKYPIKIQEPIEYIYQDSNNKPFEVLYITGLEKILDYKYMFLYVGKTEYKNSLALKNLDLQFTTHGGVPVYINEENQFKNLKQGTYYLIITDQSIQNGYATKILKDKSLGKIISTKHIGQEGSGFVVQKRYVDKSGI